MRPSEPPLISRLRARLTDGSPLPGPAAQARMAHQRRGDYGGAGAGARRAAVLALLYPRSGTADDLLLLFIQRTSPPGDRHAGQISFPGGSADPGDPSAEYTARRELEEEVGVAAESVNVLGALSPLFIPVSNFLVEPFVGYLPERPRLRPQPSEVARTLELPLADFSRPENRVLLDKTLTSGLRLTGVPHYRVGGVDIWGATAMMTSELVSLLNAAP